MNIIEEKFNNSKEQKGINIYTLSNTKGMRLKITNYGGIIVSLSMPDKNGKEDDIVLGYDDIEGYLNDEFYLGAIIGRYANRIEDSVFEINGITYKLASNEKNNHIHGGVKGFDKVIWDASIINKENMQCLQLSYKSRDGEENYPGNLDVRVTYSITDDNALNIEYWAVSDKDTVVNLTNHSYFNLSGHGAGDILNHEIKIYSDKFTPIDEQCIPTGEIRDVVGTPMDFTSCKAIGEHIFDNDFQIQCGDGYDHNWILTDNGKDLKKGAELFDAQSGRMMEVYTTKPGMQFYSGNNLKNGICGKGGVRYNRRSGLCLETQYFPNSLKHKDFPSPILLAGQEYKHTTIYKFHIKE